MTDVQIVTDPDLAEDPALPGEPRGRNLLEIRWVARLLRSRWYPGALQVPVAAVFGLVGYQLLAGPGSAHDNAGTALMWVLWWPLIPILFLVVGRFWCAICPFATLMDLVQKAVGLNRPVPKLLKRYGIWLIDASFIAITWADHVWGVVGSPWGSGILLLLLTTAVVITGALYQRRAFCRYLCFLGGLAGNYARTGMVSLRADQDICATCTARAACYNGTDTVPGCPLFSFPRTMDSSANCNLCANCVKSCPNDALVLTVRRPTRELWFVRSPKIEESFLAMAIMGIVLIQNITMLEAWDGVLAWVERLTGITSYAVVFTVAFLIAVSVPVGLLALASHVASLGNVEGLRQNFTRFGYALIPLDIAAHLAHNLFHLLAEGGSVVTTVGALVGLEPLGDPALVGGATIRALQLALVGLGVAGSLYTARRLAHRRYRTEARRRATFVPYAVLVTGLGVLNVVLFLFPMAHRM